MSIECSKSKILAVLPVYNEETNLKRLLIRILNSADYIKILIVNDGSTDKSLDVARDFQVKHPERVFISSEPIRRGRGYVIKKGYKFAIENNFSYLIEMDTDLSHAPEDIVVLLKEISGADMVIGSRLIKNGSLGKRLFLRNLISFLGNLYLRVVLRLKIRDLTSGFRCWDVNFLRKIDMSDLKSNGPQLLQEIIFKNKNKISIKEAPIIFQNRYQGKSKFDLVTIFKSLWLPLMWRTKSYINKA